MSTCAILLILAALFFFLALIPPRPHPARQVPWTGLGFLVATLAALVYVGGIHGVR